MYSDETGISIRQDISLIHSKKIEEHHDRHQEVHMEIIQNKVRQGEDIRNHDVIVVDRLT